MTVKDIQLRRIMRAMKKYFDLADIELVADAPQSRRNLHIFLKRLGYKSMDDFYYLDHTGKVPNWQTSNLITINLMFKGLSIYETEEDLREGANTSWDCLTTKYLLAYQPQENIDLFLTQIHQIVDKFKLTVRYGGEIQDIRMLKDVLHQVADRLTKEEAPPGSKDLRILIEMKLI